MSAFHGDLSIVTRTYTRPSFNRSTGSIEEIHIFCVVAEGERCKRRFPYWYF